MLRTVVVVRSQLRKPSYRPAPAQKECPCCRVVAHILLALLATGVALACAVIAFEQLGTGTKLELYARAVALGSYVLLVFSALTSFALRDSDSCSLAERLKRLLDRKKRPEAHDAARSKNDGASHLTAPLGNSFSTALARVALVSAGVAGVTYLRPLQSPSSHETKPIDLTVHVEWPAFAPIAAVSLPEIKVPGPMILRPEVNVPVEVHPTSAPTDPGLAQLLGELVGHGKKTDDRIEELHKGIGDLHQRIASNLQSLHALEAQIDSSDKFLQSITLRAGGTGTAYPLRLEWPCAGNSRTTNSRANDASAAGSGLCPPFELPVTGDDATNQQRRASLTLTPR